jgi:hypothetical protein
LSPLITPLGAWRTATKRRRICLRVAAPTLYLIVYRGPLAEAGAASGREPIAPSAIRPTARAAVA